MLVRNYRTKTTSHVEKERFIGGQTVGLTLSGPECSSSTGIGSGLYRRGHTIGKGGCSSQRTAGPLASIYL
jgi:hypothetical protein